MLRRFIVIAKNRRQNTYEEVSLNVTSRTVVYGEKYFFFIIFDAPCTPHQPVSSLTRCCF